MSNRQQFSEYASLKATDRLVSRLSPRRTSPRMRNSPSMAETQGRSPERDSSFQTPVISDLQAAYAKALNTIDTLKAEKAHMKNTMRVLLSKRNGGPGSLEEADVRGSLSSSRSPTNRNLESKIRELEHERAGLRSQLDSERAKYSALRQKYDAAQEKLSTFDDISALNVQLREEMARLSSELFEINNTVLQLEVEKKPRSPPILYNKAEIEECVKYVEYMLGLVENLDTTHYAKIFFNERFIGEMEILYDLQQQKHAKLLLDSFKYITDLLVNIIPHGAKVPYLTTRATQGPESYNKPSENARKSAQIPNLKVPHAVKRFRESPRNDELETNIPQSSTRGIYNDTVPSYHYLSNPSSSRDTQRLGFEAGSTERTNASEHLKQMIRQKIAGSHATIPERSQGFSRQTMNTTAPSVDQTRAQYEFDQMENYDSIRRVPEHGKFKSHPSKYQEHGQNMTWDHQRFQDSSENIYPEAEVMRRQPNRPRMLPLRADKISGYMTDRGTDEDRLEAKSWQNPRSHREFTSHRAEIERPYPQMSRQQGYLIRALPINVSENQKFEFPEEGYYEVRDTSQNELNKSQRGLPDRYQTQEVLERQGNMGEFYDQRPQLQQNMGSQVRYTDQGAENQHYSEPPNQYYSEPPNQYYSEPPNQYYSEPPQHSYNQYPPQKIQQQGSIQQFGQKPTQQNKFITNRQSQPQVQYHYYYRPNGIQVPSEQASSNQDYIEAPEQQRYESHSSIQGQEAHSRYSGNERPVYPTPSNRSQTQDRPPANRQLPPQQFQGQHQKHISNLAEPHLEEQGEAMYSDPEGSQMPPNKQYFVSRAADSRQRQQGPYQARDLPEEQRMSYSEEIVNPRTAGEIRTVSPKPGVQNKRTQESIPVQRNRNSSSKMLPTIDEQHHLSEEAHESRFPMEDESNYYQSAQRPGGNNRAAPEGYYQAVHESHRQAPEGHYQAAPEGYHQGLNGDYRQAPSEGHYQQQGTFEGHKGNNMTDRSQPTIQPQARSHLNEGAEGADTADYNINEPFNPRVSEISRQSQGSKPNIPSAHSPELEAARYEAKIKKTDTSQVEQKEITGAQINPLHNKETILSQELAVPFEQTQELNQEQQSPFESLEFIEGTGSLPEIHQSPTQSQDVIPQDQQRRKVSLKPIQTSKPGERSKSEESSGNNSGKSKSGARKSATLNEYPRVSRFTTGALTNKSPTNDKYSPLNTSQDTGASRRNRELSFQVSFGKTHSLDPSERVDRFETIYSDTVSIDNVVRRKHISPNPREFNILSNKPQSSPIVSPMNKTGSPNITPDSAGSITRS